MKKLILHADDFGFSSGVNDGIISAFQQGAVTSASVLVNFPTSLKALQWAKQTKADIGWHINLVEGKPITPPHQIPSLVQPDGTFHRLPSLLYRCFSGQIKATEVETELSSQLHLFLESGMMPTHLDGHLHTHLFPPITHVIQKIIRKHPIRFVRLSSESGGPFIPRFPARTFLALMSRITQSSWKKENKKSIPFYGLSLGKKSGDISAWKNLLQRISSDVSEIMVHPGHESPGEDNSTFPYGGREQELKLLLSLEWKELIEKNGFQLTSFANLVT